MEHQFWQKKWDSNEIGFHQDAPHPLLEKHFPSLGLQAGSRVFVPLCGKSSDMITLKNQGYKVVGLELSEIAVQAFFSENQLDVQMGEDEHYKRFQSANIEIMCGDFFAVTSDSLGKVSAVFDRAALIALPAEMRRRYVAQIQQLALPCTQIMLIALEYEQDLINPPPFSVYQDEVNALYDSWCDVELLEKAAAVVKGKPCNELAYRLMVW